MQEVYQLENTQINKRFRFKIIILFVFLWMRVLVFKLAELVFDRERRKYSLPMSLELNGSNHRFVAWACL